MELTFLGGETEAGMRVRQANAFCKIRVGHSSIFEKRFDNFPVELVKFTKSAGFCRHECLQLAPK